MPLLTDPLEFNPEIDSVNPLVTPDIATIQQTSQRITPGVYGAAETLGGIAAGGALDLADTIVSSIPGVSNLTGMQRGDLNQAALRAIDSPYLDKFYEEHKGGIEAASALYGVIGATVITDRLVNPTGMFMKGASKLPYLRRVATLDAEYATAMQNVRNIDSVLAAKGALGVEQYVGRTTFTGELGQTIQASRRAAGLKAKATGFALGARNAAVTEGIMAASLNQNDFLYDDSAAHNMAWMGLGIATGGAFEWLSGAYQMRKFVNSDEMRRVYARALDPQGIEESRVVFKKYKGDLAKDEFLGFLSGDTTDRVTNILTSRTRLVETPINNLSPEDATYAIRQREAMATENFALAQEEMQKVTTKGIVMTPGSAFVDRTPGLANHLHMAMYRDPGSMYGVEMMGRIADDATGELTHSQFVKSVDDKISDLEFKLSQANLSKTDSAKLLAERKQMDFYKSLSPQVLIDGEALPLHEAASFENFVEPKVVFNKTQKGGVQFDLRTPKDQHGIWEAQTESNVKKVTLDSDFQIHFPGKMTLDDADHYDILRLYRLGNKAIDHMSKFQEAIKLPENPNWFQLDMAEQILKANPGAKIVWPSGMTRDSAIVESFVQKAEALKKWESKKLPKGETLEQMMAKLRVRYNIPRLSAYERGLLNETSSPVEALMKGTTAYSPAEIRKMSPAELKDAVSKYRSIYDPIPASAGQVESLSGSSFRFMMDDKGNPLKPILMYRRPFQKAEWTQDMVAERIAARKMQTIDSIRKNRSAPVSKSLVDEIMQSPDFDLVSRPHELADIQIQGNLVGSSPQSFLGSLRNATRTSEWRDRDSPILLAASRFRDSVMRKVRDSMKAVMEGAFEGNLAKLENPRNASSKLLLNQFHSYRHGWDLADKTVKTPEGLNAFVLSDTRANRERFRLAFNSDLKEGQMLLSPNGTPVVLDDLALDLQKRFNQVTDLERKETNSLLRSVGLRELNHTNWYVPPPKTQGKFVGFVFGPDNKVVPGMSVIADTVESFNKGRKGLDEAIQNLGPGYVFREQKRVGSFANLWDRAQMDWIDPSVTPIRPGKANKGALGGQELRSNAFQDSLEWSRQRFLDHGDDLIETLLRDPINAAKARAEVTTNVTRNKASRFRDQKYNSVFDMYLENLLGKSKLDAPGSPIGTAYRWAEGIADRLLAESTPPVAKVWAATNEWLTRHVPFDTSASAKRDFVALSDKLGPYMPFESVTKMLESEGAGAVPPTLAKITGDVNRFSAAMLLRVMEVVHPIMNLTGIVNAMPSVIRQMIPRTGETASEFASRVGHSATIFTTPKGNQIGVIDMNKLGARAFKRAWSKESEKDFQYMVQRGYLSQEVAEFQRQFGAIDSPGTWKSFFSGNAAKSAEGGAKGKFYEKGLIGWLSVLSDKSEDFSRSWGHMVGLELADQLGLKGKAARHSFAHDVANKMIANYSPQNRPEVFQGALGSTLGLFQSFILNYYQRLFRYVETKDYQALGAMYATQGALFGITSLPGYSMFTSLLTDDKGSTPTDGLYSRFSGPEGDLIGHGLLSQIPALFGGEAADFYSRGDVNPRIPGIPTGTGSVLDAIPGTAVLRKLYQGIGEGLDQFSDSHPGLSGAQLAEVASNMIANRPIAGMIEQFLAGGNDTDRYGQLVSETRSASEAAYRLIGIRSMRQSREIEAFYANKNAQEQQAGLKATLRLATRASMRDGTFGDKAGEIFQTYLDQGGDPRYFRRWVKENYQAATETRGERQLDKALKGGSLDDAIRLLDAGVGISEDENTVDPYAESDYSNSTEY